MSDDLEDLARRGKQLREEDAQRRARESESSQSIAASEAEARVRSSISRFGRYGWWLAGVPLGFVVGALVAPHMPDSWRSDDSEGDLATFVTLVLAAVPMAVLFGFRRRVAELAVARERAWVRGLPFELSRYPEALGNSTTEGTFTLELHFAADSMPPDAETLAAAFRTAGAKHSIDRGVHRMQTSFDFGDTSVSTNAHVRAWLRRRAIPCLEAVHGRHRLTRVEVVGFR